MAHLVQLLVPLYDNRGEPVPSQLHEDLKARLSDEFGGLTAYTRSPAEGLWKEADQRVHDDIIVYEVMCEDLNVAWWRDLRILLEGLLSQSEIVIRALHMRHL